MVGKASLVFIDIHLCEGVSLDLAFTQVFNARIRITCKNSVNCICIKNRIHCTYKTYIFTQRHKNISKSDNVVKYKFCYYICSIKMLILLNLTTHMLTVIRTRAHNWVAPTAIKHLIIVRHHSVNLCAVTPVVIVLFTPLGPEPNSCHLADDSSNIFVVE